MHDARLLPDVSDTLHTWPTLASAVWVVGFFGWHWWRRRRNPPFPNRASVEVLFEENWASGHSLLPRNYWWGAASNCLSVVVTPDELWVTSPFPFAVVLKWYDLEQRIPRDRLRGVRQARRDVIVDFERPDGRDGRLTVTLRRPEEFVNALGYAQGFEVVRRITPD